MAYLYVTMERFNDGNASATRVLSFCKILKELGKEVIVISLDEVLTEKIHVYKGIKYISLRSLSNSFKARAFNFLFHSSRLKKCIATLSEVDEIDGLFFYDIPVPSIFYLKKLAKNKSIKLFHDSVEWYSPEQFQWGAFALPYILKNLLNKYFIDKQISVFAISSYLNNYFHSKGIRSTRMPIMMDMDKIAFEKNSIPDKLKLLYAGSPGKKDYLKEMVEGLGKLKQEELEKIELQLLGVNKKQLIEVCHIAKSSIEKCGNSLLARGTVSREEVLNELQKTDFTVLLRSPELRYAKAGFPTKVVESLATATPVICNITSDLGDYLSDGENSLIVEACTAEAFGITLRKALSLTIDEKQLLSYNARKTAEQKFDYRKFKNQFNSFLCEK
jgi:glycosyltransferase involved in cell wall biosynthesis